MFIYKITVKPINKIYIGLDTLPSYKMSRWKEHCKNAFERNSLSKIHSAMRINGINNCEYEVIEDNIQTIGKLALKEIEYIKKFNSYQNGLNSTPGGDGLGIKNLSLLTDDELKLLKKALGERFRLINSARWQNTDGDQRKEMTKYLHTEDVIERRKETLKKYYETYPEVRKEKGNAIKQWQEKNRELLKINNKKNGQIGADKVSKKILVEFPDGNMLQYKSKSEFRRNTGMWIKTILDKTKKGTNHNGYRAWEL